MAVQDGGHDLLGDGAGAFTLAPLGGGDHPCLQRHQLMGGVALDVDPGRDGSPIGPADGVADRRQVLVGVGDLDDLLVGGQELVGEVFNLGCLGAGRQLLADGEHHIPPTERAGLLGQSFGAAQVAEDAVAVARVERAAVGLPQHGFQVTHVEPQLLGPLPPAAPQGLLVDRLTLGLTGVERRHLGALGRVLATLRQPLGDLLATLGEAHDDRSRDASDVRDTVAHPVPGHAELAGQLAPQDGLVEVAGGLGMGPTGPAHPGPSIARRAHGSGWR